MLNLVKIDTAILDLVLKHSGAKYNKKISSREVARTFLPIDPFKLNFVVQLAYLIQLAHQQHKNPGHMQNGISCNPCHPSIALSNVNEYFPKPVRRFEYCTLRLVVPIQNGSVQHLGAHYYQTSKEADEMLVVICT